MSDTSVAAAMAERVAERLRSYRGYVARCAAGEVLCGLDVGDSEKCMRLLGLPSYAFRRDVIAMAGSATARGYRRAELLLNHPHLFDEVDAWVAERVRAAAERGRGGLPCRR
jgi:hypothetical protein